MQRAVTTACSWVPAHMTVMSKRPTNRRANSLSSRARGCTTVQARQPLWLSTCTGLEYSIPSRLHSRAWPRTTGRSPTSATRHPTCTLLPSVSTAAFRPSPPPWTQSPASLAGPTKSACTTAAQLPALTDDRSRFCHFFL